MKARRRLAVVANLESVPGGFNFHHRGLFVGHPDVTFPDGQIPMKELKILPLEAEEAAKMRKRAQELASGAS